MTIAVAARVGYAHRPMQSDVSTEEAHRLVEKEGGRLVDVRTPPEYAQGHLEGAINIPLQVLQQRVTELEPKDKPIILYCHSGMRSARAAQFLKAAGYQSVYNLGGPERW